MLSGVSTTRGDKAGVGRAEFVATVAATLQEIQDAMLAKARANNEPPVTAAIALQPGRRT